MQKSVLLLRPRDAHEAVGLRLFANRRRPKMRALLEGIELGRSHRAVPNHRTPVRDQVVSDDLEPVSAGKVTLHPMPRRGRPFVESGGATQGSGPTRDERGPSWRGELTLETTSARVRCQPVRRNAGSVLKGPLEPKWRACGT